MLRPIKVEMVLRSPPIYIFRDIISDNEAEELKSMARPMVNIELLSFDYLCLFITSLITKGKKEQIIKSILTATLTRTRTPIAE